MVLLFYESSNMTDYKIAIFNSDFFAKFLSCFWIILELLNIDSVMNDLYFALIKGLITKQISTSKFRASKIIRRIPLTERT